MANFKGPEKIELKEYFLNDDTLQKLSETELIENFLDYIRGNIPGKEIPTYKTSVNEYDTIIREANAELLILNGLGRATPPAPGAPVTPASATHLTRAEVDRINSQEARYTSNKARAESAKEDLEKKAEALAQETAKWAKELTKLEKEYNDLNKTYPDNWSPIPDIDTFKNTVYSVAMSAGRESDRVISDHTKLLALYDFTKDDEVSQYLDDLNNRIASGTNPLKVINSKKSDFETAINQLKTKKDSYEKAAGGILNTANLNTYKTDLEGAKKIYEEFNEINIAKRVKVPDTDIDAFKNVVYSAAIAQPFSEKFITAHKDALAKSEYSNDDDVIEDLERLNGLISANPLEAIINNKSDVEKTIKKLKDKKASFDTAAGTVLNTANFNTYKTDLETVSKEYGEIRGKLDMYVQDPLHPKDLNGSLLNFFDTYGTDVLETIDENMKKNDFYETVFGAYVANTIDSTHGPDYIKNEVTGFDTAMTIGTLEQKKNALKNIKKLQGKIETITPDATKDFNEFLQRTYKNVNMSSSIDGDTINRDYPWVMFTGEENAAKPVNHHKSGTYAQAGLGYYFETFVEPLLTTGYDFVKELEHSIVNRHAKASSILRGGLFNRKKKNRIYAREVLKLGLGYGVLKNNSDTRDIYTEINDAWADVLGLNAGSNIQTIIDTYDNAADLGEELNHTAESWSHRHDTGYDAIDNEVNRLAGSAFTFTDWLGDFGKRLLGAGGFEGWSNNEKIVGYDVDKETAIQTNDHPHLKSILIGSGALYGGYKILERLGNTLQDESKGVSGAFTEILKEVGVVAGFRTAEKVLSKPAATITHTT